MSPAGYRFIRKQFDDKIPSQVTIRGWYANSDVQCHSGIIEYSLNVLTRKANEMAAKGKKLVGCLLFDEMSIHKLLQFAENNMIGFENVPGVDKRNAKIASEVLTFMFSGINEPLQLPVAYYFASKLEADIKGEILSDVWLKYLNCVKMP